MKHSSVTNLENFVTLKIHRSWTSLVACYSPQWSEVLHFCKVQNASESTHVQFLIRLWFWCNLDVLSCTKYRKRANSQSAFLALFCQDPCLSSQLQVLEQFKSVGAHLEKKKKVLLNATQSRHVLPLMFVVCFTSHCKAMVCSITCLHSDCAVQVLIANLFCNSLQYLRRRWQRKR